MSLRRQSIVVDTVGPGSLGRWWADLLGGRFTAEDADGFVLEPPVGSPEDGTSPDLPSGRVSETKHVWNRLHIDLRPDDQEREVARAEALGASRIDIEQNDDVTWVVLADPQSNEFSTLQALAPDETP